MASKNRLSVNFTSSTLLDYVKTLARVNKMSHSYVAEELIKSAVIKGYAPFVDFPGDSFKLLGYTQVNSISPEKRLHLGTMKEIKNEMVKLSPLSIPLPGFSASSTHLSRKGAALFSGKPAPKSECNKKAWKINFLFPEIENHLKVQLPIVIGALGEAPDIAHIFLHHADVAYHEDTDGTISAKIIPHIHVLPLINSEVHRYHIDHANITYKNFKQVLSSPWQTRKYSHHLLLEHASSSRSGGYFIGFCHQPERDTAGERHDFFKHESFVGGNPTTTLCKIHIQPRDIKIKENPKK